MGMLAWCPSECCVGASVMLNVVAVGSRVRPEPDYPAGNQNGTGIPVLVNRNLLGRWLDLELLLKI